MTRALHRLHGGVCGGMELDGGTSRIAVEERGARVV